MKTLSSLFLSLVLVSGCSSGGYEEPAGPNVVAPASVVEEAPKSLETVVVVPAGSVAISVVETPPPAPDSTASVAPIFIATITKAPDVIVASQNPDFAACVQQAIASAIAQSAAGSTYINVFNIC